MEEWKIQTLSKLFIYLQLSIIIFNIYILYENLPQPMPGHYTSMPRKEKQEEGRKGKGSGHIG